MLLSGWEDRADRGSLVPDPIGINGLFCQLLIYIFLDFIQIYKLVQVRIFPAENLI